MSGLPLLFILTVSAIQILTVTGGRQLNDYILHFEELHYDTQSVHDSHLRHKRSVDKNVNVKLDAFNRTFHLELKHSSAGFAPDFVLEFGPNRTSTDLSFLYAGKIKDDPKSKVHGAIIEGIFRGAIHLPTEKETYHVEKSQHVLPQEKPVFHSVIYKESDMNLDPYRELREKDRATARETGTCGYSNALKWMKETVQSEVVDVNRAKRSSMEWQEVYTESHNKYTVDGEEQGKPHRRKKRASLGEKNSCFMSLTSDVFLWNHFMGSAGNNAEVAKDEILAFFANHLNAINKIYGETTFLTYNDDMSYSGVQFTVQKTKVMTEEDCQSGTNPLFSFCQKNVDVSNFLNMNSLLNHDLFCLAYVFTYRDFSQGTLGLAWVGASNMASGGVCERNKAFDERTSRVYKSLNTGIVTIINYGKKVPSKVSQLTFAHEIGHNFGSPHDSGTECAPYGTSAPGANLGNFIMFASATMGDQVHNSEFSVCSKDNVTRVLHTVLTNPSKYNCFKKSGPFCGNGILEDGEDCDCGFYDDCQDDCCIPKEMPNTDESQFCKLKPGKVCSPTQGPCCNTGCNFVSSAQQFTCRYEQDCAAEAKCDGTQAACPLSDKAQDGTFCQKFGFTCVNGECAGSLCEHFGWTECFTTGRSKTKAEQEQLCKLGCSANISGVDTGCILSDDIDTMTKLGYDDYKTMVENVIDGRRASGVDITNKDSGVQLAPGSACNNFQGYCDVFYRCRGVDAEGPLSRLKNLIFDPETLQDISNWIQEHWWAVLLMGIGLVLAMGLFIKFCAVHTPSSNPKAKPARKLSETMTLRRRRNQNRQNPAQSQPQQVRYPQKDRGYRERDYRYAADQELLPDPKYPAKNPQGPPPPYPGSSSAGSHVGPPHGHGKKGKGRKSKDIELGRV